MGVDKMDFPVISDNAVSNVTEYLKSKKYSILSIFEEIRLENPKVAEYLEAQIERSKYPVEVRGVGVMTYLLLREQFRMDVCVHDELGVGDESLKELLDDPEY